MARGRSRPVEETVREYRDSAGKLLQDGDTVTVIKDLKLKGGGTVKMGTKVKNIRLVDSDHDIDCKVDAIARSMRLQDRWLRRHEPEDGVCQEGLTALGWGGGALLCHR